MRLLFLTLTSFILVACATAPVDQPTVRLVRGDWPQIGEEAEARVGDEIYSTGNYFESDYGPGVMLATGIEKTIMLNRVSAPQGTIATPAANGEYCTEDKVLLDPIVGPWQPVCLVDRDADGAFEKIAVRPGLVRYWRDLDPPVQYVSTSGGKRMAAAGGFKKELVFQGVDGQTLRVMYREFSDDMARPAFSQDLTYPIAGGRASIIFRDLIIDVTAIESTSISYVVKAPLN